jgi:cytochrome c-type biogenesis protein CcmH/NrfG
MQRSSFILLVAGFLLGYGLVFTWTKQRAPEVVRAMAKVMPARLPGGAAAPPPLDVASVQRLMDVIKQNPRDVQSLLELGNMHFDQNNFTEAAGWYEKALEVEPQNANIHADLGTTYFYSQRVDESIAEFQKALTIDPIHPQALYNIGVAYLHGKNDSAAALQTWERLVQAHPTYPRIDVVKEQIETLRQQGR